GDVVMTMGRSFTKRAASLFGALLLSAAPALADVASFTYSDLDGDFNSGTSTFTAINQSALLANPTSGDVTRLLAPVGTSAIFDFGSGFGSSAFNLSMSVSAITGTTASSSGTM